MGCTTGCVLQICFQAWGRGDLLFLTDLEAVRRRAIFLHWHRQTSEEKKRQEIAAQLLQEKLHHVSMARLALAEGLQGAQGAQLSHLFLRGDPVPQHGAALEEGQDPVLFQHQERRLLKRRQLAASLVDGSSRLGQQMTMSQVLFAWSGLANDSKAAEWARKTAHAMSAKAALAARIAFGATTGGLSDFVQRWHAAARTSRHARAKEAAREALEVSLKRRNLKGCWDRWVEALRLDTTERWLQEQREADMRKDPRTRAGGTAAEGWRSTPAVGGSDRCFWQLRFPILADGHPRLAEGEAAGLHGADVG
eukprot:g10122.t1